VLKEVASRESFLAAPVGRYVRGRGWLFVCAHAGLYATFLAGRPDENDLRELTHVYGVRGARHTPHVTLFDASRVETIDAAAMGVLLGYYQANVKVLTRSMKRVAVVHGDGAVGAVFAGYPSMIPLPNEYRQFAGTDEALAWLGADEALRAELRALADSVVAVDPEIQRLRALLDERLDLSVAEAARALGLAARSLQRRLERVGTSFQRELDRARLDATIARLGDAERDLTSIALDVGFASLQSFTDWFRAQTGEPPRTWRKRHVAKR
jgi:AraC-like DNA-binding protein